MWIFKLVHMFELSSLIELAQSSEHLEIELDNSEDKQVCQLSELLFYF